MSAIILEKKRMDCTFTPLRGGRYRCNQTGKRVKARRVEAYRRSYLRGEVRRKAGQRPATAAFKPQAYTVAPTKAAVQSRASASAPTSTSGLKTAHRESDGYATCPHCQFQCWAWGKILYVNFRYPQLLWQVKFYSLVFTDNTLVCSLTLNK